MKYHLVYQTTDDETIFESDATLKPPPVGVTVHLPSLSEKGESNPYHVQRVQFAPDDQGHVTIFIKVEPV